MNRRILLLVAIVLVTVLSFTTRSEANYWACDCYFCYMYPSSDCISYSGLEPRSMSCAWYYLDPANQCL